MDASREPKVGLTYFLMLLSAVLPIASGIRFGYRDWGISGALIGALIGLVVAFVSFGGIWRLGTPLYNWLEHHIVRFFGSRCGKYADLILGVAIGCWIAFWFVATACTTRIAVASLK